MGEAVSEIRDLMKLAAKLKEAARDAAFPGYADHLSKAAADLELQARYKAERVNDPEFDRLADAQLHRPINLTV